MVKKHVILVEGAGSMIAGIPGNRQFDYVMDGVREVMEQAHGTGDEVYVVAFGRGEAPLVLAGPNITSQETETRIDAVNECGMAGQRRIELAPAIKEMVGQVGADANLLVVSAGDIADTDTATRTVNALLDSHPNATVDWVVLSERGQPSLTNEVYYGTTRPDERSLMKHVTPYDKTAIQSAVVDASTTRSHITTNWQQFVAKQGKGDRELG